MNKYLLSLILLVLAGWVYADEAALKNRLQQQFPGLVIEDLRALDNTGLYEAVINSEVVYFSADGRYVFQGDVIELQTRENITERSRNVIRRAILATVDEKDMIIFEPEKTEYTLTVFTDIDCGFCRKLHSQIAQYNELGIRIRYMAYPRSGIGSKAYEKAVSVWCAKDRKKAMTQAKSGQYVEAKTCDNPVRQSYEIGNKMRVSGTPAMYTESGQLLPGYVPPKRLKQMLDAASKI